jgi:hypothetical protein
MQEGRKVLIHFDYIVTKVMPIDANQQAAAFWTKSEIDP